MSQLHTVNKSPLDRGALESAVNHATKGSAILMIEDGVYGAMNGTSKSSIVTDAIGDISFYAMGPDLKARGIDEGRLIPGIKIVDYNGFVALVAEHKATQSWL